MIAVFWGVLVGLVFSLIGAAGGILTSFGLISILSVSDPNTVKPMAQLLTLATALFFIPGYYRQSALVWPLALLLAIGGIFGAFLGSSLSSIYLSDMSSFKPWFGVLTLIIAAQIFWKELKGQTAQATHSPEGVENLTWGVKSICFKYGSQQIVIHNVSPLLAGGLIAMVASAFGVGGGFLLVPYMASLLRMPMFIIPATAALAIFASGTVSVVNYIRMGSELDGQLLVFLLAGGNIGAVIGPKINRHLKNSWLNRLLAMILFLIGLKYLLGW